MGTINKKWSAKPLLATFGAGWTRFADLPAAVSYGLLDLLMLWQERASQRSALGRLEARDLRDLGLSRMETMEEVSKPFWRA